MEILLGSLLGLLIGSIVGIYHTWNNNKVKKAEAALSNCRFEKGTLYVSEQNKLFASVLVIKKHEVSQYREEALKVHVGAATVGGVTTGGVYTTGGGLSQTDYRDGRVKLIYMCVRKPKENEIHLSTFIDEHEVNSIVLSDKLAAKAKKSGIKEHLNGNRIVIVQDVKPSKAVAELMRYGRSTLAVNQLSIEKAQGYPSREKCEAIIAWLCEE